MKILFFSNYFYPHIGGVEKHVLELSKELISKGNNVSVVTQQFDKKLPKIEIYNKITIYRIDAGRLDWFQKFRIWRELLSHIELIKNSDIIHCHDVFFWYLPFKFLFFWKKVFVTFHGYESYPVQLKNIIMRKIAEALASGNICIGDFMREWYFTKPTAILYGGVTIPSNNFPPIIFPSSLFYGRLDDQTGIREYVKAVKLIKKSIPKFKFTVIGDGKYKKLVSQYKNLGFKINPENELRNVRFAFLSRYLSILEALAAKKLVFALYDNEIKEDYLRMSPFEKFIIVVGSPEELCERILYYIANPQKEKQFVERGYRFAKENSWKKIADAYQALWRKSRIKNTIVMRAIVVMLIASAVLRTGVFSNFTSKM